MLLKVSKTYSVFTLLFLKGHKEDIVGLTPQGGYSWLNTSEKYSGREVEAANSD